MMTWSCWVIRQVEEGSSALHSAAQGAMGFDSFYWPIGNWDSEVVNLEKHGLFERNRLDFMVLGTERPNKWIRNLSPSCDIILAGSFYNLLRAAHRQPLKSLVVFRQAEQDNMFDETADEEGFKCDRFEPFIPFKMPNKSHRHTNKEKNEDELLPFFP